MEQQIRTIRYALKVFFMPWKACRSYRLNFSYGLEDAELDASGPPGWYSPPAHPIGRVAYARGYKSYRAQGDR